MEQQRTEEEVKEGSEFEARCHDKVKSSGFDSSSSPAPLEKIKCTLVLQTHGSAAAAAAGVVHSTTTEQRTP